eukprot:3037792-Rhodomonas_salina.4
MARQQKPTHGNQTHATMFECTVHYNSGDSFARLRVVLVHCEIGRKCPHAWYSLSAGKQTHPTTQVPWHQGD